MSLSLQILSLKGEPVSEQAVVFDGEGSIGRLGNNTLVLPDPDKFVSRTHATISVENQQYILKDLSLSGTYIDQQLHPLKETPQILSDGMHLRIGNYVVLVSISNDESDPLAQFDANEFPPPENKPTPFEKDREPSLIGNDDGLVSYVADEDNELNKLLGNQQDSPFGNDAPAPQNASFDGLLNANLSPLHDSFTPPAPQQTQQSSATDDAAMPDDFNFEDLFDNHSNEVTSIPDIQSQNSPAPNVGNQHKQLCAAFLEGAELNKQLLTGTDATESMQRIGQMFRKLVSGTMTMLKSRSELKNMFRVSQTYIKTYDNNALKFSTSTDEALSYLISNSESGFKDSLTAIDEGFDDIMLHQLAMQAAIQASLKKMLKQFDPQLIEQQLDEGLLLQKKSKCWEKYSSAYPELA
ncbi:MAG: type VI secretion system-associated FHA domain protein TagH, partial [Methylococcaceae bacterium]|nr:type VI secretion system-associated FHA domain protein TagH [Methylococcaceae bacterium]